jgi:hypothetical protein
MKKFYILLVALFTVNGAIGQGLIPGISNDAFLQSKHPESKLQHRKLTSMPDVLGSMETNGREVSEIFVEKKPKESNNHRIPQQRSLFQIYDSIYNWQWDTGWNIKFKTTDIVYDENNNLVSKIRKSWYGFAWENDSRYTYTYDANNNRTSSLGQTWNGTSWENDYKYINTYDANNNNTIYCYQTWNGSSWENVYQYIFTYDANNNETGGLYQEWNGSAWENNWQYFCTYDAKNNETSELYQEWNGNAWENNWSGTFTYDAKNNMISVIGQSWNGTTWENSSLSTCIYDVNNNLTGQLTQTWNGNAWENDSRYTYNYDARNNRTNSLGQTWNGTSWENDYQNINTYDASNNKTSELSQEWNGTAWLNSIQKIYTYDANNFIVSYSFKMWIEVGTAIMLGDSTYYYYHTAIGINDLTVPKKSLTVYPNPAFTNITIETITKGCLSILNLSGQQLLQREITEPTTTVDISTLPSGVYIVKLVGKKGVQMGKVIKQ